MLLIICNLTVLLVFLHCLQDYQLLLLLLLLLLLRQLLSLSCSSSRLACCISTMPCDSFASGTFILSYCGLMHGEYRSIRFYTVLQVCADTLIGDDQIRGVSGGQRKRVTTGEPPLLPLHWHCVKGTVIGKTHYMTLAASSNSRMSLTLSNQTFIVLYGEQHVSTIACSPSSKPSRSASLQP